MTETLEKKSLLTKEHIQEYNEKGYTIVRNVFNQEEINEIATRFDRWHEMGVMMGSDFRKGNTVTWMANDHKLGLIMKGMQWPSYEDEIMNKIRLDKRLLSIVEPFIGNNIKQIINQLHWKHPGSKISWALHRDVRSRKPFNCFRNLATSYVQTGLAIDPHRAENGAMKIVPGSHKECSLDPEVTGLTEFNPEYEDDPRTIDVEMNPGDVGLWTPFTIHGGGFNSTKDLNRRLYINGYVKAEDCDRGEWTWENGKNVPFGKEHALVQNDLKRRQAHFPSNFNIIEQVSD